MSDRNLTFSTVSQCVIALVAAVGLATAGVHYVSAQVADVKTVKEDVRDLKAEVQVIKDQQDQMLRILQDLQKRLPAPA